LHELFFEEKFNIFCFEEMKVPLTAVMHLRCLISSTVQNPLSWLRIPSRGMDVFLFFPDPMLSCVLEVDRSAIRGALTMTKEFIVSEVNSELQQVRSTNS
jgi:hypothetical protein